MTSPRERLRVVLEHLAALEPLAPRSVNDARDALSGLALVCHAIAPRVHLDDAREPVACDYDGVPAARAPVAGNGTAAVKP